MKRKKLSFLALGNSNTLTLSFKEINKISPLGLIEIFNSFAKVPLSNDNSLVVAGHLADKIDIDHNYSNPRLILNQALSGAGLTKKQITCLEDDLIKGKTIVIEA